MARPIRMLHVGRDRDVATSPHRLQAFREMGYDVTALFSSPYTETGNRWVQQLRLRLYIGPGIRALNREFVRLARQAQPEIIWLDKQRFISGDSIRAARAASRALVIDFQHDDPFGHVQLGWGMYLKALPAYDVHIVPRDVNIQEYHRIGCRHVVRYHWGYNPHIHRPMELSAEDRARLGGPVGFIGDWEKERADAIYYLASHGIPVRIWGPNWHRKCERRHPNMRIEGTWVCGEDYPMSVNAFDINLGFLRKINRDLSTTRSVEIPACGAFLLAERTTEHQQMFQEGQEAEFFDSHEELLEKTRYYLDHPEQRQAIAARGRQRCLSSGYDHAHRQRAVLSAIGAEVNLDLLEDGERLRRSLEAAASIA